MLYCFALTSDLALVDSVKMLSPDEIKQEVEEIKVEVDIEHIQQLQRISGKAVKVPKKKKIKEKEEHLCTHCGKKFSLKGNLLKHVMTIHEGGHFNSEGGSITNA